MAQRRFRMLRPVDPGRELLCISVRLEHMVAGGKKELVRKDHFPASPTDFGAVRVFRAAVEQGWKETLRRRRAAARRTYALRREVRTILSVPLRAFRRQRQIFQRRSVGRLLHLPGGESLEK